MTTGRWLMVVGGLGILAIELIISIFAIRFAKKLGVKISDWKRRKHELEG